MGDQVRHRAGLLLWPRCPRSEGWGHCWTDAFLSGPLGQVTRLGARDPGWPECRVPGERLRGGRGQCWSWGPRSSCGAGRRPSTPDGSPHAGLAAGAETLKSCRWPCLSSPGVVFAGRQFYKPRGPGREPQAPGGCGPASSVLSLFLGLRAGGRAQAGSGLRLWGESCLAALSPAQDCPQLPVQAQPGLTQCPHGLEPRSSTQIEGRDLRAVAAEFLE